MLKYFPVHSQIVPEDGGAVYATCSTRNTPLCYRLPIQKKVSAVTGCKRSIPVQSMRATSRGKSSTNRGTPPRDYSTATFPNFICLLLILVFVILQASIYMDMRFNHAQSDSNSKYLTHHSLSMIFWFTCILDPEDLSRRWPSLSLLSIPETMHELLVTESESIQLYSFPEKKIWKTPRPDGRIDRCVNHEIKNLAIS